MRILLILLLFMTTTVYSQKYEFELIENFDFEQKELFQKIQLEFNDFKNPYKNTLVFDGKFFFINTNIEIKEEEFSIFLNKHGYTLKTFTKIQ